MDNTNLLIRDYLFIRKLGAGGMGEVWLGEDTNLERRVAIKILNPELSGDPALVARFKQEAKLQARLVHKNIVTLCNFFTEQERSYMVMEFAQGITLKDLIRREGRLSEQRTLGILNQLLDALAYAHSMDIIHRDIKPANIMVDPDSNDFVKIMDFGIAKALGEAGLTQTGTRMGTLFYMSPEQIRAEKDIDCRTDIYSLGVTLHEMVTGRLPYDADSESPYTIQHNIITQEFIDPRTEQPNLSESFCSMLHRMTEKTKEKRYASVLEISPGKTELEGKNPQSTNDANAKTIIGPEQQRQPSSKNPDPAMPVAVDQGFVAAKKYILTIVTVLSVLDLFAMFLQPAFPIVTSGVRLKLGTIGLFWSGYCLYFKKPKAGLIIVWIACIWDIILTLIPYSSEFTIVFYISKNVLFWVLLNKISRNPLIFESQMLKGVRRLLRFLVIGYAVLFLYLCAI